MKDWTPLPQGVAWTREPLFDLELRRSQIVDRFSGPQHVDLDSNGVGDFDAWTLRFHCGLEVALWWPKERRQLGPDPLCCVPVRANDDEWGHTLFHLGFGNVTPLRWEGYNGGWGPKRWRVTRSDDNGNTFEVAVVRSECEAVAIAERFERRGHKQAYWIEER